MKIEELAREVRGIIRTAVNNGEIVQKSWVVHSIVQAHNRFEGPDKDTGVNCMYFTVDSQTRKEINRYKGSENSEQMELFGEGYLHLQQAYLTDRGLVPVTKMTSDEVHKKSAELRKMGDGCYAHASELEQFHAEYLRLGRRG